jgi:uncharacterized protein
LSILKHYRPYCFTSSSIKNKRIHDGAAAVARSQPRSWRRFTLPVFALGGTLIAASASSQDASPAELARQGALELKQGHIPQALALLQKGADAGDPNAQYWLGTMYVEGKGVKQSCDTAISLMTTAANKGLAIADTWFGTVYDLGSCGLQNDQTAIAWLRKGYAGGDIKAAFLLGELYSRGEDVTPDYPTAMSLLMKVASYEQPDDPLAPSFASMKAAAQYLIGTMYEHGRGVAQDYALAAVWYGKAAEQGNAPGQRRLGVLYHEGHGVAKDFAEAVIWLRKAADQNDDVAQLLLSEIYLRGEGVPKDGNEAVNWLTKAAGNGNAKAKETLANLKKALAARMADANSAPASAQAEPNTFSWQLTNETDKMTDKTTLTATGNKTFGDGILIEAKASCSPLGVIFTFDSSRGKAAAPFLWKGDKINIRVRIDNDGIHTSTTSEQYVNEANILFYDTNGMQSFAKGSMKNGGLFGFFFGGLVMTDLPELSAGKSEQLAAARSVRVELPFSDGSTNVVDLNPQDQALGTVVRKCIQDLRAGSGDAGGHR